MIKRIIFILFLLPCVLFAQNQNDWIDYDQSYFKFPIATNGVYRIGFQDLINGGINTNNLDPRNIQIFAKGKEIPIYIQGESDGTFDPNDFIEFYAEGNDGWYDHKLFSDSAHVLNPYTSMYTDTLYHYLTWNASFSNSRYKDDFDLNFNAYQPSPYFWDEGKVIGRSQFNGGQTTPLGWSVPEYSEGEGRYQSRVFSQNQTTYTVNTPNVYNGGPDAIVSTKIFGQGPTTHHVDISLNGTNIYSGAFFDARAFHIQDTVPASSLVDASKVNYKSVTPTQSANDRFGIAYTIIRYPRLYDLGGATELSMVIPSGNRLKDLLVMSNYNNLNSTVRIYDITQKKRIQVQPLNGSYYALIENNGKERPVYMTSEAAIRTISSISPVNRNSSKFTNYQDLIAAKGGVDFLLLTGTQLLQGGQEYADYRDSKGLKSIVGDMDQLYHQFSYGIRKHPLSIKNFVDNIINEWGYDLEYLFLCGKSSAVNYTSIRFGSSFEDNIVPTWSVLGADNGFTKGLKPGSVLDPVVATGRIAAVNNQDLRNYLNKVKQHESAEHAEWMKQILHFGGGQSLSEQSKFKNYLENYESMIEDSLYGAYVHTFLKNSSDPLQINLSDSVTNLINSGVSLMTFFGHAYGNNFDQSIDEPENYENTGRYPFILANSCLIGNIHGLSTESGSERFVLAEDKGAIGFLGSSSLGVPNYLHDYSRNFYENMAKDFYGESVGTLVKETVKDMQDSASSLNRDVALHMTLHCDPAVILNMHSQPDYTVYGKLGVTQPNVFFSPENVTSELDSFDINVIVTNIGKSPGDTFNLSITRNFPAEGYADTTYSFLLSNVFYRDTITLRLPVDKINGVGLNTFTIYADALSEIDELNETNNITNVNLFINSSDIVPIYPYDFSVVPIPNPILKASTGSAYAPSQRYFMQIDTTDLFNSPLLVEGIITSSGGVIELDPADNSDLNAFYSSLPQNTTIQDPQVFYWRVSSDSTGNNGFAWKQSSFQHVTGQSGWGQSDFHQFKKDEFEFIDYNYVLRNTSFIEQVKTLAAQTHRLATKSYRDNTKYEIDGAIQCFESSHWDRMFFAAVIDKNTLKPWHAKEHGDYGHINYADNKIIAGWSEYNFYFPNNSSRGLDSLMSFVEDVPDSNYVLIYSFRGNYCSSWLNPSKPIAADYDNFLTNIGADVDSLKKYPGSWPYILFFQKGTQRFTKDSFSTDGLDYIELSAEMRNNWFNGRVKSTNIGPASNWGSLHWELDNKEPANNKDTAVVNVYGIDNLGNRLLLIDSLQTTGDIWSLNDSIDASLYPNLELEAFFADDSLRTPNEIVRWQVLHDEIPEAAINPLKVSGYTLVDSVQQGEELMFVTAIQNISNVGMDSIQVAHRVIDNEFNSGDFEYRMKQPLAPGEVMYDTIFVSTYDLIGTNNLWYEINPYDAPKARQNEKFHFNNLYLHQFNVFGDRLNPLLDVTFDGVRIMNGDIVNPKPNIVITLDDENQFLKLDDPSLIQLFINYPNGSFEDSLVLVDPSMYTFTPANLPKNKCTIQFDGDFEKDGIYELRVMAKDRSDNISGKGDGIYDYRISFEVVTESSITELVNYPNPFSTSTRFVFTLTGSEIPDKMLIQIMTISGKVVKEITMDDLGPIRIGKNITEYAWDGTDEFGDRLANGVYLYRVITQLNGQEISNRNVTMSTSEGTTTLSDKYFKKGIGKMYILR